MGFVRPTVSLTFYVKSVKNKSLKTGRITFSIGLARPVDNTFLNR